MQSYEMERVRGLVDSLMQRIDWKIAGIAGLLAILVLFGDSLLPLLGHGLYLLIEFIEEGSENLLEWAFGVSSRQAQVILVWGGLPILSFFLWRWLRKLYAATALRWRALLSGLKTGHRLDDWLWIVLMLGALSATLFLIA